VSHARQRLERLEARRHLAGVPLDEDPGQAADVLGLAGASPQGRMIVSI